jgi:hypothetical protein
MKINTKNMCNIFLIQGFYLHSKKMRAEVREKAGYRLLTVGFREECIAQRAKVRIIYLMICNRMKIS